MFNFRRIVGKERIELHASDVPEFVATRLGNIAEGEKKKLKSAMEETKKEFYSLKMLIAELGGKNVSHAFSNTVKNNYAAKAAKIIDSTAFEIEKSMDSYDGARECIDLIGASIDEISSLKVKELRHLYAFKSDMDKISNQVKLIMKKHKELQNTFQSCITLAGINSAEAMAGDVHESLAMIDALGSEIGRINDRILETERMIGNERRELGGMEGDMKALESLEKEMKALEKGKSAVRQRFATEFGGIERVLKKFLHSGAELGADEMALAEQYTKSPEDAFIHDKSLIIKKILYEIISMNILDRKEKEKAADMIRTASILVSMRNEYEETGKRLDELEKDERLSEIMSRSRGHKEKIRELEKQLSAVNNELDRKIHEKTKAEMDVMKARKMLESMLSKSLEREITIKLD